MIAAPALPCPKCRRPLGAGSWIDGGSGHCFRCKTDFEVVMFPAVAAAPAAIAPQAAVLAADSVCFFHAENRAEAVCDGCGRLLCPVCAVPFAGQRLCPQCIAAGKKTEFPVLTRDRTLWDSIALSLAVVPLVIWPLTLVTAPVALGVVLHGWKKPGSLVRGAGRVRFVVAGVLACLEIAGWIGLAGMWWLQR